MDPYLPTWLARWAGPLLLVLAWAVVAGRDLRAGHRVRGAVFATLAAVTGAALWTHLGPLLARSPLPPEPTALAVAAAAPFLAFTLLAAIRRSERVEAFDLAALLPVATWSHGWPAWGMATVMLGRGHVLPGAARRTLLVGLLLLGLATATEARHAELESSLPLGHDDAVRVVALAASGAEGMGWLALTHWARRDAEERSAPPVA